MIVVTIKNQIDAVGCVDACAACIRCCVHGIQLGTTELLAFSGHVTEGGDAVQGSWGDDIVGINSADLAQVNDGLGDDTLMTDGQVLHEDLMAAGLKVQSFEKFDLGAGGNAISLSAGAVAGVSGIHDAESLLQPAESELFASESLLLSWGAATGAGGGATENPAHILGLELLDGHQLQYAAY